MATAWVTTPGIDALLRAFNTYFPDRDKASDGSIGDLAHQNESASSHNPDKTGAAEWKDGDAKNEVRARDFDSDLRDPEWTMEDVVQHLVALGRAGKLSKWVRYLIYNRRIWSASNGWVTQNYTGASAHTEHLHVTGAFSQTADENTDMDVFEFEKFGDPFMAMSDADMDKLAGKIAQAIFNADVIPYTSAAGVADTWTVKTAIGYMTGKIRDTMTAAQADAANSDIIARNTPQLQAGVAPAKGTTAVKK